MALACGHTMGYVPAPFSRTSRSLLIPDLSHYQVRNLPLPPKSHQRQGKKVRRPIGLISLALITLSLSAIAAGSKTYILGSTLGRTIIEQAALFDQRLFEELAECPDDDNDDNGNMPRSATRLALAVSSPGAPLINSLH